MPHAAFTRRLHRITRERNAPPIPLRLVEDAGHLGRAAVAGRVDRRPAGPYRSGIGTGRAGHPGLALLAPAAGAAAPDRAPALGDLPGQRRLERAGPPALPQPAGDARTQAPAGGDAA